MPDHKVKILKRNTYKTEKLMLYLKLHIVIAVVKTEYLVLYTFPFTEKAIVIKVVPSDY